MVKGGLYGGFVGFQELYSCFHELIAMGIDVSFVGQLVEGVEDATSTIAILAILICNPLYDRAQLHNDDTKVRSFGENISKYMKKPVPSVRATESDY